MDTFYNLKQRHTTDVELNRDAGARTSTRIGRGKKSTRL